jgi:hypothetical protein
MRWSQCTLVGTAELHRRGVGEAGCLLLAANRSHGVTWGGP